MSRKLYLIAGPNGSGKTTLAKELIKEEKVTFLNADEIAEKLGANKTKGETWWPQCARNGCKTQI